MQSLETKPFLLNVQRITLRVTHEEFEKLCQDNPDLRLELAANGELITMVPVALESSEKNGDLFGEVWAWNRQTRSGRVFDSSGGFTLPNGAVRSPDVTWIGKPRADEIPPGVTFPELVPDFAIELRSKSDSLKTLREKMEEYRSNGVRLGWLINPQQQPLGETHAVEERSEACRQTETSARFHPQVEIYRIGRAFEILESPSILDGEDVLPGFTLDLGSIL